MKRIALVVAVMAIMAANVFAAGATIKLWYGWTGQEKEAMLGLIAKYEAVSKNKVDALMVPFDALQGKFQTMSPQGQGPDVVIGPADWMGPFVMQKLIDPLDSMIPETEKKAFLPNVLDGCKYQNKIYGLPESYKCVALIYNKDLIKNPPKTTKEMIEMGLKLTDEKESKYGLVYDKGNYYYHIPWIGGFGGTVLDKNNDTTFDSKSQVDSVAFVKSLQQKPNKIMPDEVDYNVMMTLFNDGLAGMIVAGPWVIGDLMQAGVRFGVTRLPQVSETGKWPAPLVGPEIVYLATKAKDKTSSYDLIKFLTSQEAQTTMAKVGHLPSRAAVYDLPEVKKSKLYEYISGFKYQSETGYPMPTAPEMSAAGWANGATMLSKSLSGEMTAQAAGDMVQKKAEESIKDLRSKK